MDKIFSKILVITLFIALISCEDQKKPVLKINGDNSWFKNRSCDTTFFLEKYNYEFSGEIEFPPKELSDQVDISLDVSGSSFKYNVEYNKSIIPLAEYNLIKLIKLISNKEIIRNGDKITLHLFGENKKSLKIANRESKNYKVPGKKIKIDCLKLTRHYNDLQINVLNTTAQNYSINELVDSIKFWYQQHIDICRKSNGPYISSPLIDHINSIISNNSHNSCVSRTMIIATDGWVELGNLFFWPSIYAQNPTILDSLKSQVIAKGLKPNFKELNFSKIVLIGLNDGNYPEYRLAQINFFKWFFSPLDIELIPY